VGALFLAFVAWVGPGLRDDLWFLRYQEACNRGDAEACAQSGWRYMRGRGVKIDWARGHELLNNACHDGVIWACSAVGTTHWWAGESIHVLSQNETSRAARLCLEGELAACDLVNALGLSPEQDYDVEQTQERCRAGDRLACWSIFPQSLTHKWDIADAMCSDTFAHGCPGILKEEDGPIFRQTYWHTARFRFEYREERQGLLRPWAEGKVDDAKLIGQLSRACEVEAHSCVLALKLRAKHEGVIELAHDWSFALAYYRHACRNNDPWGCWGVGKFREHQFRNYDVMRKKIPDFTAKPASEMFERACEMGRGSACADAARSLAAEKDDPSLRLSELERHCKAQRVDACDSLIAALRSAGNPERAEVVQEAVCQAGAEKYCDHWLLGRRRP
jgi:TPR repeat protein